MCQQLPEETAALLGDVGDPFDEDHAAPPLPPAQTPAHCGMLGRRAAPAGLVLFQACVLVAYMRHSSEPMTLSSLATAPNRAKEGLISAAEGDVTIPWTVPVDYGCTAVLAEDSALPALAADVGEKAPQCTKCPEACTNQNKQKAIYTEWTFDPPLTQKNIFDISTKVEWTNFGHLKEYGSRGIFQAMHFRWSFPSNIASAKQFGGYMGAQIVGKKGGRKRGRSNRLVGQHIFSIWDTHKPDESGTPPRGRRLVVPSDDDPGNCKLNCQDCGHSELAEQGQTTGTQCKITDVDLPASGAAFVYRIRKRTDSKIFRYGNIHSIMGAEWEVTVQDANDVNAEPLILGRVILEDNPGQYGINRWRNFHEHIGCTPCDAWYEKTKVTGPFVHDPVDTRIRGGSVDPIDADMDCQMYRVTSEGHSSARNATSPYTLVIETGPGVTRPDSYFSGTQLKSRVPLFSCEATPTLVGQ